MRKMPEGFSCLRSAIFSSCSKYRYELCRLWNGKGKTCVFIGLNPSTADEYSDDATIRRCIGFAKNWGYGQLVMVNLFAYRSTDPALLKKVTDPVGRENDQWLLTRCQQADLLVFAWGNMGALQGRDKAVKRLLLKHELKHCKCFKLTKQGQPSHPLYQPKKEKLYDFKG